MQKILSTLLAARLGRVIEKLVSIKQSVFIKGRNILDGVLLLNEILDLAKRDKRKCLVIKVDYEKAYDSICWKYLRYLLIRIGFGDRWLRVNGSNTEDFKVEQVLRQGGPLSPLLFVIVMEGLTRLVKRAVELGDFNGFGFGEGAVVDILQFVDDIIIIGDGSNGNLWSMKVFLRGFEVIRGLKVNFSNNNIYGINISDEFMCMAATFLSCSVGIFPFKFFRSWLSAAQGRLNYGKKWWRV